MGKPFQSNVAQKQKMLCDVKLLYDVMADTIGYIKCETMKRRPCWCPKPVLWELNSFLMQTLSFVPINLHRCSPRERKHSIQVKVSAASLELARIHVRSTHCARASRDEIINSIRSALREEKSLKRWIKIY